MDRRALLQLLAGTAASRVAASFILNQNARAAESTSAANTAALASKPRIALTMDDPALSLNSQIEWREANRRILDTLEKRKLKIALFVCGMRVDAPEGRALLGQWDDAGHLLGNHSYSHKNLNAQATSYDAFVADFQRNEPILAPYRHRALLFRFPGLKEGDTTEKRDRFRAFLNGRNYRNGAVTVDASDWYVDDRMCQRLRSDSGAALEPYRDYLVDHLLNRASYYRQLALDVLGHEICHTLLVHYRTINALFLPDVMAAFEKAGWEWIDAPQAFDDPAFLHEPKTLPAGESLVWALAAESGRFRDRLRYPGEDDAYEKPRMDALGL